MGGANYIHANHREEEAITIEEVEDLRIYVNEPEGMKRERGRTIGQWNLFFPVRKSQSKSSDVANSQLIAMVRRARTEEGMETNSQVQPRQRVHEPGERL